MLYLSAVKGLDDENAGSARSSVAGLTNALFGCAGVNDEGFDNEEARETDLRTYRCCSLHTDCHGMTGPSQG